MTIHPRVLLALGAGLFAASVLAEEKKVTYEDDVIPILRARCANCHNMEKARADLNVMSYQAVLQGGSSGEVLAAGDASASKFFQVMNHQAEPKMPPNSPKMPDAELATIKAWIDGGLIENKGGKAKASKKPKVDIGLASAPVGKPAQPIPLPTELLLEPVLRTPRDGAVTTIASNPWAPLVAVGSPKQVTLYNSDTLDIVGVLAFPEGEPHVLKFSRNGRLLLVAGGVGGKSGRAVLFDFQTGKRIVEVGEEFDAILAADISGDQQQIAIGGSTKLVKIYSTETGEIVHTIKKHTDWITAIEYSPDSVLLASGDRAGGLIVWESHSGREFYTLLGHQNRITDVTWRADSNVVASASEDGTIRLFEMFNGTQAAAWSSHGGVLSLDFTHDGRLVSCGRDRLTRIWDGAGKQLVQFEELPDLSLAATFTHDGARVLASCWNGEVRVWAAAGGARVGSITSNPPSLAERLDAESKLLAELSPKLKPAQDAFAQANAALEKLKSDLPGVKRTADEAAAAQKAAEADLANKKAALDASKKAMEKAQADEAAKQKAASDLAAASAKAAQSVAANAAELKSANETFPVKVESAKKLAEAATAIKQTSTKAPNDKALADAAAKSEEAAKQAASVVESSKKALETLTNQDKALVSAASKAKADADKSANELAAAKKANVEGAAAFKAAEGAVGVATAALQTATTASGNAAKALAEKTAAFNAANDAATKTKAELDRVSTGIAGAQARQSRWTLAQAKARVFHGKEDLAAKQARRDELTAAVKERQAGLEKASVDLKAKREMLAALPSKIAAEEATLVRVRPQIEPAQKGLATSKAIIAEKEELARGLAEMGAKLKAHADRSPNNKVAADAVANMAKAIESLSVDLSTSRLVANDQGNLAVALVEELGKSEKLLAALKADLKKTTETIASLEATQKDLAAKLAAESAEIASLGPAVEAAKKSVEEHAAALAKLTPKG